MKRLTQLWHDRETKGSVVALVSVVILSLSALLISLQQDTFSDHAEYNHTTLTFPGGVSRPGLAMELAASQEDVGKILSAGTAKPAERDENRDAIRWMQYFDFPFIVAYTALFLVIARRAKLLGFVPLRWIAYISTGTAVAAALLDLLEDTAVLLAVRDSGGPWPVRPFGFLKWAAVFVTALLQSSVFFAWSDLPMAGRILSLFIGSAFVGVGLLGIQSVLLRCDTFLETSAGWLFVGFGLLVAFVIWRFFDVWKSPPHSAPAASLEPASRAPA